jgi:hypothetical protein
MQKVYSIEADYISDRHGDSFRSVIYTDGHLYADKDTAQMTADLLNLADDGAIGFEVGLHGNDEPVKYFVFEMQVD